jgi:phosphohistidine phosphatase
MKQLVLIRHAHALSGSDDHARPLSARGEEEARSVARQLLSEKIIPDGIICSSSQRTTRTAKIMAEELCFEEKNILLEKKIYNTGLDEYQEALGCLDDNHHCCFLVGHNFTISNFAHHLTGVPIPEMQPCTAVVITFVDEHWDAIRQKTGHLKALFTPK